MSFSSTKDGRFLREVVEGSSYGIFVVDAAGDVVFSNGFLEGRLGVDSSALLDEPVETLCTDERPVARIREAAATQSLTELTFRDADDKPARIAATCETTTFDGSEYVTLWCQESATDQQRVTTNDGYSGDEVRNRAPVAELTSVGEALLKADDSETVAAAALDGVTGLLGSEVACVRLFDEETEDLERVATTDGAAEMLRSLPAFELHKSLAGRSFRRNEPVLDTPGGAAPQDIVDRSNLHVPLGDRGTLTVVRSEPPLTERDIEPAVQFASLVAARLEQVEEGADVARDGCEVASPFRVRDILLHLVEAETREAVQEQACDRLVATDLCDSAWFLTTEIDGQWRAVEASAGRADSLPDGIAKASSADADDLIRRAVTTDEVCLRRRQTVHETQSGDGPGTADETTVVVPVSYAGRTYGVLALHAECDRGVDGTLRSKLRTLSEVVGLAAYAAESRKLLLSERIQQLEFEVTDPDCLAVAVSDAVDAFCEVQHQTLTNDGHHLCFLDVDDTQPGAAVEATEAIDSVSDCRVIEDGDEGCLLEVVKIRSGAEAMMDVGATVRRATADSGVGTLLVETPISADVREVVEAYTDLNPQSHLVAKREVDRSEPPADALGESFEDALTDRQYSVLTTAYYAGYYDWPRANTAEEIADSLDISPATLHQHLRGAERKLLDLVCEEQPYRREG